MKVTMLYFNTIGKVIKEHGYTWNDVDNIQDYKGRVIWCGHKYTLEDIFYTTHMDGFGKYKEQSQVLIESFLEALKNPKAIKLD